MDDRQLWLDVLDALDFEPGVDAANVGVAVNQGVAVLSGYVRTYADKVTATEIVESIRGIRAVADEIEVRPVGAHVTADDEIAKRIGHMLKWSAAIPDEAVHVTVRNGVVTLTGGVGWRYQAEAAERVVRGMRGVTGVENRIAVQSTVRPADVSERIRRALVRDAELDASGIRVVVTDTTVTLEGRVRYLGERRTAERAAWSAPGVTEVIDRLSVI